MATYAAWTDRDGSHSGYLTAGELVGLFDAANVGEVEIDYVEDEDDYDDEAFSYGQY
jgi:hypothetical protein